MTEGPATLGPFVCYRVVSMTPDALAAEFVDGPLNGVLEVEPL